MYAGIVAELVVPDHTCGGEQGEHDRSGCQAQAPARSPSGPVVHRQSQAFASPRRDLDRRGIGSVAFLHVRIPFQPIRTERGVSPSEALFHGR